MFVEHFNSLYLYNSYQTLSSLGDVNVVQKIGLPSAIKLSDHGRNGFRLMFSPIFGVLKCAPHARCVTCDYLQLFEQDKPKIVQPIFRNQTALRERREVFEVNGRESRRLPKSLWGQTSGLIMSCRSISLQV